MLDHKPDELILGDTANITDHRHSLQLCMLKVEDRLSTGTDESVVAEGLQMVDSTGDSHFANNDYNAPVDDQIHAEEDGSDDGGCYFSQVSDPAEQHKQQQLEEEGSYSGGGFGRDN